MTASGTFKEPGWLRTTSRSDLFDLNTTSPRGDELRGDKLVWVMKEVPGEVFEF